MFISVHRCYKIVNLVGGQYYYLYHGVNGRKIPQNKWLKANKKQVIDGTGGTQYLSGFHVFLTKKEAKKYLKQFTAPRLKSSIVVIEVFCDSEGLREKKHSRADVFLADKMLFDPDLNKRMIKYFGKEYSQEV